MELKISDKVWLEISLPLIICNSFRIQQSPNEHALIRLIGWLDMDQEIHRALLEESKIKVWTSKAGKQQILFHGYLTKIKTSTTATTKQVVVEGISASWLLDRQSNSRSFQNIGQTFAEVAGQTVREAGGFLMDTLQDQTVIGCPVIQYQETVWEFSKRMASHVGSQLVAEMTSGAANLWLGLEMGKEIPAFSETEYSVDLVRQDRYDGVNISYQVTTRENYEIGDQTRFLNQSLCIWEKTIRFELGELQYNYLLGLNQSNRSVFYNPKFGGLGLHGWVLAIQAEQMKIALEIDQGKSTGEYWYPWYPETGNVLYAMPEPGAPITLSFSGINEQEAMVLHCLHREQSKVQEQAYYKNREFNRKDQSNIWLSPGTIDFCHKDVQLFSLLDAQVSANTVKQLNILAKEKVNLQGKRIIINAEDEINIYQG